MILEYIITSIQLHISRIEVKASTSYSHGQNSFAANNF